jgi:GNAT superfamily N-acetyltransferase
MTYAIAPAADAGAAHDVLLKALVAFNAAAAGDPQEKVFALTIADPDTGETAGGLWAMSLWGSFYIALVIVPEAARGQGLGGELMRRAEAQARAWGCHNLWLDTFAFQARPFYERLGFSVFGQLDGPSPAFPRYFMRKTLPRD